MEPKRHGNQSQSRSVYFVSDSTGVTAETFGRSLLAQFGLGRRHDDASVQEHRLPFIDSIEKAAAARHSIDEQCDKDGVRALVFSTLVDADISAELGRTKGLFLDLFASFIGPLERELELKAEHVLGAYHAYAQTPAYRRRIEAIDYALATDDGQRPDRLREADVVLVGVSRCGKTPTSLYLAMQHGLKVANVPLTPEDFERGTLPAALAALDGRVFGLTIAAVRLSEIRQGRRPGSRYAMIETCAREVEQAAAMMAAAGIPTLSSTSRSIEEIAATVLQHLEARQQGARGA
jgi:regulator of PEP synthase PpsR (kinase-PPPase family)